MIQLNARFSNTRIQSIYRIFAVTLLLTLNLALTGCDNKSSTAKKSEKKGPAKIEHPKEGNISQIVLTPKAEQRLQIKTVAVEKRKVPRTRTVGGVITIPDGASMFVTAPLTGTLLKASEASVPKAGEKVKAGQTLFHLLTLLSPEREVPTAAERAAMANAKASLVSSQIIADGDVKRSIVEVDAAEIVLNRAKQLFADKAGSERDLDDAQARFDIFSKTLETARERKRELDKLTLDSEKKKVKSIAITAPQDGTLRTVTSSVNHTVSVGAQLFEVVNLSTFWVRVPVYPGLHSQIARQKKGLVRNLGGISTQIPVEPVTAPPSADPQTATVDLYYQLSNADEKFHPGERVEVTLPMKGEQEALVVPRAAILRDIHGVAWVYVALGNQEYRRHRVEVNFTTDMLAVLSAGPPEETPVVVDGAAELFGTEFGAGK